MRAIAAVAGVDLALVVHFFGSKDDLFREVLGWPFDPAQAAGRIAANGVGVRAPRPAPGPLLSGDVGRPNHGPAPARGASRRPYPWGVRRLLREFFGQQLFTQLGRLSQEPPDMLHVQVAASQLVGIALLRYGL